MVVDKRHAYESCEKKKCPKKSWNKWLMKSWPSKGNLNKTLIFIFLGANKILGQFGVMVRMAFHGLIQLLMLKNIG